MRRALLPVLLAAVTIAVAAAPNQRGEQLCWTGSATTPYTATDKAAPKAIQDGCEIEGEFHSLGLDAFEPTMGAAPDGGLYYAVTPALGVALGWEASVGASMDGGVTWTDIRPNAAGVDSPPETNDPYTYVDPMTGRVFAFHMGPILTCSILSWTDDGGDTWDTNPAGCAPTGAWDHQTLVAARPVDGVDTYGYPNVLVQCVNAIYAAECGRSLDGGRTWHHTVPVHVNSQAASLCGAQHGHLAADEAGVIYLPTSECGTAALVYTSRDSGLTWQRNVIDPNPTPFEDPAIAVDADGTVHAAWADEHGAMLYAQSYDGAATWSPAVRVTPHEVTGKMPSIVAGDGGKVAFIFVGTDDYPNGYGSDIEDYENEDLEWGGFATWSEDNGATWTTVEATGTDPLMRGPVCGIHDRCQYQVDFLGSTITPDGRIFGALIDACLELCNEDPESGNDVRTTTGDAVVITVAGVDLCAETCPRFPPGAGEAIDAGTPMQVRWTASMMDPTAPSPRALEDNGALRGYFLQRDRFLAS